MDHRTAVNLLRSAIHTRGGTWADLGAGSGVFTRALSEVLGPDARIYAVDRDARGLEGLARWSSRAASGIMPVTADFTSPFDLPSLGDEKLDGILLANSLHFVHDPDAVLARLARAVKRGGHVVLVEYDHRSASRWVPYPIPSAALPSLAVAAGLSPFEMTVSLPSAYGGQLYVAAATS